MDDDPKKPKADVLFCQPRGGFPYPPVVPMATDPSFKYVINPNHELMRYWDLATTCCLLFTMSVTPFEVAFLVPKIDGLFFVNRSVDLVFLIDIALNFFLMYIDRESGKWVSQLRVIQYNYMRGTFAIDIVSILPFDVIGIIMNSPAVSQLKVLRVLRLLKLTKLLRILKAGRLVRRIETTFSINYSAMQLYGFGATVLVVAHWLACLLRLAPALVGGCTRKIYPPIYLYTLTSHLREEELGLRPS